MMIAHNVNKSNQQQSVLLIRINYSSVVIAHAGLQPPRAILDPVYEHHFDDDEKDPLVILPLIS